MLFQSKLNFYSKNKVSVNISYNCSYDNQPPTSISNKSESFLTEIEIKF